MNETRQYCTFHLDGLFFGVEVSQVQEVLRYQDMTRVPLAPPMVRGLINLRGQIVTAFDLRQRLGMPPRPADEMP
jgi:purine-binding chemotaxis protein CheW